VQVAVILEEENPWNRKKLSKNKDINKGNCMKINIGPYLNWWGPYQILALLQYIGFSEDTTDKWAEKSPEWFVNACQWVYDKRKRKEVVRIDKYDTWSADSTLAIIIIPMLKQLKATKHGTPTGMFCKEDGVDEHGNPSEEAEQKAIVRWDKTIDHIIWSFQQVIEEDYESFQIVAGEMDLSEHIGDVGKVCTPLRWKVEPKTNWDAYLAHQERVQEGLDLFGKHYRSLWD
jgi:hypothetical protein